MNNYLKIFTIAILSLMPIGVWAVAPTVALPTFQVTNEVDKDTTWPEGSIVYVKNSGAEYILFNSTYTLINGTSTTQTVALAAKDMRGFAIQNAADITGTSLILGDGSASTTLSASAGFIGFASTAPKSLISVKGNINASQITGEGIIKAGTLIATSSVQFPSSSITSAMLVNSAVTINTTAPLGGGGQIGLGDTVTFTCTTCIVSTTSPITTIYGAAGYFKGNWNIQATSTATSFSATGTLSVASSSPSVSFAVLGHSVLGGNLSVTGNADIQGTLSVATIENGGSTGTTTFTGGVDAAALRASTGGATISAGDLLISAGKLTQSGAATSTITQLLASTVLQTPAIYGATTLTLGQSGQNTSIAGSEIFNSSRAVFFGTTTEAGAPVASQPNYTTIVGTSTVSNVLTLRGFGNENKSGNTGLYTGNLLQAQSSSGQNLLTVNNVGGLGIGTTTTVGLGTVATTTILGGPAYIYGQLTLPNFIATTTSNNGVGTTSTTYAFGIGGFATVKGNLYVEGTTTTSSLNATSTLMIGTSSPTSGAQLTVAGLSLSTRKETQGKPPTLSSCGTAPSIVGNDQVGTVTIGSAAAASGSACTVTFTTAWRNTPVCLTQTVNSYGRVVGAVNITTTAFNLKATSTPSSVSVMYWCFSFR